MRSWRSISPTDCWDETSRLNIARRFGSAMISNTDSISCVYCTAHIRVKVYLGRRLRQQWPKWISIASSRLCVTSGRLLRNTLLRMMWFFRSPAGYSRKPTKPYRGGNVDSRKVICEVAQRDCRSSFRKALGIGIVKPPSDQRTRPSSWLVGKPYLIWSDPVHSCESVGWFLLLFEDRASSSRDRCERRLISLIFAGRNRIILIRRELPLTYVASPAKPVAKVRRGFSFVPAPAAAGPVLEWSSVIHSWDRLCFFLLRKFLLFPLWDRFSSCRHLHLA